MVFAHRKAQSSLALHCSQGTDYVLCGNVEKFCVTWLDPSSRNLAIDAKKYVTHMPALQRKAMLQGPLQPSYGKSPKSLSINRSRMPLNPEIFLKGNF